MMPTTVIPGMIDNIIDKLKDLQKSEFCIEDTVLVYDSLDKITNTINELTVRDISGKGKF